MDAIRPYIAAVSGVKNSGKTTFLEKLIPELKKEDTVRRCSNMTDMNFRRIQKEQILSGSGRRELSEPVFFPEADGWR